MQVTAQVINTRAAVSGLESAQELAASWSADPSRSIGTSTRFAQVSLLPETVLSDKGRPESQLTIRVDYLRN